MSREYVIEVTHEVSGPVSRRSIWLSGIAEANEEMMRESARWDDCHMVTVVNADTGAVLGALGGIR